MFKRTFVVCAALLLAGAVLAQAYRWVDEDGVVHYSDRPEPGAERIELPTFRPSSGPRTPLPSSTFSRRNDPKTESEQEQEQFSYESLEIASPADEETLWNIEGVLNAQLNLQPALQRGHRVRVYHNGTPQMVSGTSFQIQEVYRGAHNLQAEVVDQRGKLMIRSQPRRFYVQKNVITRRPAN